MGERGLKVEQNRRSGAPLLLTPTAPRPPGRVGDTIGDVANRSEPVAEAMGMHASKARTNKPVQGSHGPTPAPAGASDESRPAYHAPRRALPAASAGRGRGFRVHYAA